MTIVFDDDAGCSCGHLYASHQHNPAGEGRCELCACLRFVVLFDFTAPAKDPD